MRDIEDRLRQLGDRVERWNTNHGLPGSTLSRIKRQRRTSLFAGGVVASTVVLGISSLVPTSPRAVSPAGSPSTVTRDRTAPAAEEDEPAASAKPIARDDFFGAVWPEDSRQETSQGCSVAASSPDSFRADAARTALEFGHSVMGWSGAEAVTRDEHGNSKQIELSRADGSGSAVYLSMLEYTENCWSVQSVGTNLGGEDDTLAQNGLPMGVTTSNTTEKGVFSLAFDAPAGSSGRVELAYGDYEETKRWNAAQVGTDDPINFAVGPFGPHDAGHFLIFFEDASGRVKAAVGAYLNPSKGLARPTDASGQG